MSDKCLIPELVEINCPFCGKRLTIPPDKINALAKIIEQEVRRGFNDPVNGELHE